MPNHTATLRLHHVLVFALMAGIITSCESTPVPESASSHEADVISSGITKPTTSDRAPRNYAGLHNVVAYHEDFYSGSVPNGEGGFESLQQLGITTIISVDGAAPEVEVAEAYGMKYIHLPIGYDGFELERQLELARAARDGMNNGPVYVHCHHGKHRSAGAAGTIAVSLGWGTPEQMVERMRVSGTSPNYKGLYRCTSNATTLPAPMIDRVPADFPSVSMPEGLVKGMVEVSHAWEHLKSIKAARWEVPDDHPDLVPAAEAGRLADLLRLMQDDEKVQEKPADFSEMLRASWAESQTLEDLLVDGQTDPAVLTLQFDRVARTCKACHHAYRD